MEQERPDVKYSRSMPEAEQSPRDERVPLYGENECTRAKQFRSTRRYVTRVWAGFTPPTSVPRIRNESGVAKLLSSWARGEGSPGHRSADRSVVRWPSSGQVLPRDRIQMTQGRAAGYELVEMQSGRFLEIWDRWACRIRNDRTSV